jgi:iron-sulfur cluster repair protein YtfE (RIC family)
MPTLTEDPRTNTAALSAARDHHAELRDALVERTEHLLDAVGAGRSHLSARDQLLAFLRSDLFPHLDGEASLLYTGTATRQVALLVQAMQDEHRMLKAVIEQLADNEDPLQSACLASALVVLFDVRAEQEDQLLLPALAAYGLPLPTVLADHPEIVGPSSRSDHDV